VLLVILCTELGMLLRRVEDLPLDGHILHPLLYLLYGDIST